MRTRLFIALAVLVLLLGLALANRQRLPWWPVGDAAAGQRSGSSGGSGSASAAGPYVRVTSMQLRGRTNSPPTNVIARLMREEQEGGDVDRGAWHRGVETYLQQHNRSAESLLAAARVLRGLDLGYLREAKEKYPNDPRVAYAAFYQPPFDNRQAAPEERRQWLDAFKQAAPDNALPGYLSARDDFKAGRTAEAVQEVLAAVGKPMQDYALDSIQNAEQAYLAAGLPEAEAAARASSEQPLPQLAELKQLTINLVEYAKTQQQSGDPAAAQSALQAAVSMGGQLDNDGPFLINNLVGIAVQQIALNAMDPTATLGDTGQTVQSQLDALTQHKLDLRTEAQEIETVLPYLTDQEVAAYFDRIRRDGEAAAVQWLLTVPAHP
jgi:hypothetical protein